MTEFQWGVIKIMIKVLIRSANGYIYGKEKEILIEALKRGHEDQGRSDQTSRSDESLRT